MSGCQKQKSRASAQARLRRCEIYSDLLYRNYVSSLAPSYTASRPVQGEFKRKKGQSRQDAFVYIAQASCEIIHKGSKRHVRKITNTSTIYSFVEKFVKFLFDSAHSFL
jgi:hypothetical protein